MLPIKNCIFPLLSGVLLFSAGAQTPLQISTTSVPVASQYQSYNTALAATGGTPPYTWSVVSAVSLPEGMSLNPATGVVSATQVAGQGGYAVAVQVTDSASPSHNVASAPQLRRHE
ncbi:MAG TPA: Ig domain-containing protein [Bryobacteraceae bacterium]|nr:Ig domain-containing protein [Bryobacteraceae bacterium]